MKTIRMAAVGLLFAAFFAVSAFAQAAGAANAGKIVLINTQAFDSNQPGQGITKYVNAMNQLETEFKPVQTELDGMSTRLQTIAKEVQTLRESKAPVNQQTLQTKVDEGEKLQVDLKRKQEDAKLRFEKRQQQLMGPVMQDIYKAMQEFTKKNGYLMILDVAKLVQAELVLGLDDTADVTKAFIAFYNTRPAATTASAATPK